MEFFYNEHLNMKITPMEEAIRIIFLETVIRRRKYNLFSLVKILTFL